jgi:hypothetical protein
MAVPARPAIEGRRFARVAERPETAVSDVLRAVATRGADRGAKLLALL